MLQLLKTNYLINPIQECQVIKMIKINTRFLGHCINPKLVEPTFFWLEEAKRNLLIFRSDFFENQNNNLNFAARI